MSQWIVAACGRHETLQTAVTKEERSTWDSDDKGTSCSKSTIKTNEIVRPRERIEVVSAIYQMLGKNAEGW
jgi:hypothetical protein